MLNIIRKIAYLRGLCEGSGFGEDTKEGKIFSGILDVLDDIVDKIDEYQFLENFDGKNDEADDKAEYSYAFICPNCGQEIEVDEDIIENEEELVCPSCGNIIPVINEFADFDEE